MKLSILNHPTTNLFEDFDGVRDWSNLFLSGHEIFKRINPELYCDISLSIERGKTIPLYCVLSFIGDFGMSGEWVKNRLNQFCHELKNSTSCENVFIGYRNTHICIIVETNIEKKTIIFVDVSLVYENYLQALQRFDSTVAHYGWNGKDVFTTMEAFNAQTKKISIKCNETYKEWFEVFNIVEKNSKQYPNYGKMKETNPLELSISNMPHWRQISVQSQNN